MRGAGGNRSRCRRVQFTKDLARELETFGIPLGGYDSSSDVDDRSDVGSVVSKASSRRTSRSGMTGNSSATVRPSRPRPTHTASASTITRLSRVTFDESSISASQSQSSDIGDFETDTGLSYGTGGPRGGLPTEFTRAGDGASESADMYMEPSTTSGSTHTRVQMPPAVHSAEATYSSVGCHACPADCLFSFWVESYATH